MHIKKLHAMFNQSIMQPFTIYAGLSTPSDDPFCSLPLALWDSPRCSILVEIHASPKLLRFEVLVRVGHPFKILAFVGYVGILVTSIKN